MTFKVGDKVQVTNANLTDVKNGKETTITSLKPHGAMLLCGDCVEHSAIDENNWHWFFTNGDFEHIGKKLTELNVKPGDVVKCVQAGNNDGWSYTKEDVIINERGAWLGVWPEYFHELTGLFVVVSRSPITEPTPPRKMHPDDFVNAVNDFARDNGFSVKRIEFHGVNFSANCLPCHEYFVD